MHNFFKRKFILKNIRFVKNLAVWFALLLFLSKKINRLVVDLSLVELVKKFLSLCIFLSNQNICFFKARNPLILLGFEPCFSLRLAGIEPAASESESDVLSIKLQPHIFFYLFHIQPIYHSR